jgi:hypothetical protein
MTTYDVHRHFPFLSARARTKLVGSQREPRIMYGRYSHLVIPQHPHQNPRLVAGILGTPSPTMHRLANSPDGQFLGGVVGLREDKSQVSPALTKATTHD